MDKKKLFCILILLLLPIFIMAQTGLENEYPTLGGTQPTDGSSPAEFFKYVFNLGIIFGVVAAVFVLISQGVTMLMAKGEMALVILAKEKIKRVFVGLLILLGAYMILTTINPDLQVIKFSPLEAFENIINGPGTEEEAFPESEFEEIPLGSILESILAANSSERIYDDKTEELCYAYDENGDTIDRNDDKKIDENDLLKGMDMYYCLSELNKALIKKVKDLNGGNSLCDGLADGGPIEEMKSLIASGCSCSSCDVWKPNVYCPGGECYQCKTYACGECSTCCRDHCSCCGKAYYSPDLGCQAFNDDKTKDPCGSVRDGIDCARNEIKLRVDGTGFSVPGAAEDQCAFTKYFKENEYKFLTLKKGKERLASFKSYFQNHLADLRKAESMMKSPYGERISLAEFQAIQGNDQYQRTVAKAFQNINSTYSYNSIKYCRDFNCTAYKDGNEKNLCVSGERADLTQVLMEKEKLIDPLSDKLPIITDKRICAVDEDKESYSYDGDGATFYFQEGYKTKTTSKQEECSIDSTVEKEMVKSLIPIGETVDATEKFAEDVLLLVSRIDSEMQEIIEKAEELSVLPEQCDCSQGCWNESDCECFSGEECTSCSCSSCLECEGNSQVFCECCECMEAVVVSEGVPDPEDDMRINSGSCPSCPAIYPTGNQDEYWTYCPCSGSLFFPNLSLINDPDSRFCYLGEELGPYCSQHFQEEVCQEAIKKLSPICKTWVNAPKFVNYDIVSCETVSQEPVPAPALCWGGNNIYYTQKSVLKLKPNKTRTVTVCEGQEPVEQEAVNSLNKRYMGLVPPGFEKEDALILDGNNWSKFDWTGETLLGDDYSGLEWTKENQFILRDYFFNWDGGQVNVFDFQGLLDDVFDISPPVIGLPEGHRVVSVEVIPSDRGVVYVYWNKALLCVRSTELWLGQCTIDPPGDGVWFQGEKECEEIEIDGAKKIRCTQRIAGYRKHVFARNKGYALRFTIENTKIIKAGEPSVRDYYVCPYSEIKANQCSIFRYDSDLDTDYPENLETNYGCQIKGSTGVGHLQKIELLNERLENLIRGENMRDDDINRWTLLEMLSLSRKRMESCVRGYGWSYKADLTEERIFSCQEGIDAQILHSLVVLPDFPHPKSEEYWNCYPLNSDLLTEDEKKSCYANKDAEGTEEDPKCQRLIQGLMDNYYCCQGE
ncbi:MAG: hypothetical protein WC410_00835 [Candidatus Paceibacterota bacterium]|jgi:hypothetical protein|nr:hypothetical protein [Candidatus Paceibacterota bacterium]MDD5555157.1 hypothetical protein [Candidatus Paceibacterota bacterium]